MFHKGIGVVKIDDAMIEGQAEFDHGSDAQAVAFAYDHTFGDGTHTQDPNLWWEQGRNAIACTKNAAICEREGGLAEVSWAQLFFFGASLDFVDDARKADRKSTRLNSSHVAI